jgi:hypothetical protein
MSFVDLSRRQFVQAGAGLATLAVAGGSLALAADDTPEKLFDGESLKGWHKNPKRIGHGTGGSWVVENGAIAGEQDPPGSGNGGILLTDAKFGNFELDIDLKPDWGVCSGLFLRSTDDGRCWQMMVDYHDRGNVGHIYGEGTGGFNTRPYDIDGVYNDKKELTGLKTTPDKKAEEVGLAATCTGAEFVKAWKVNDWNTAKVRVEGGDYPTITTWINGLKVCVFDGANSKNGGYKKDEVLKALGAKGSVAVQVHGGQGWPNGAKCRWKNIKIKAIA